MPGWHLALHQKEQRCLKDRAPRTLLVLVDLAAGFVWNNYLGIYQFWTWVAGAPTATCAPPRMSPHVHPFLRYSTSYVSFACRDTNEIDGSANACVENLFSKLWVCGEHGQTAIKFSGHLLNLDLVYYHQAIQLLSSRSDFSTLLPAHDKHYDIDKYFYIGRHSAIYQNTRLKIPGSMICMLAVLRHFLHRFMTKD